MADKIRLRVVTPSRLLLDDVVDEVTAPGALGEFGVLPNHIAFLTLLVPGELSYKEGMARRYMAVSGGYAEVLNDVMTVLAPAAEFSGEIDTDRARQARESAEKRMGELNYEDKEFDSAEAALRWANARLQVAGREARR
ncbi:MAG TPA: F0F1 ATP synthase subunit epsilon [Candidatus Binatia bacterium]|nr:F0F1 ATP synthase subunit epsilon [Candidatus Binatia bacterium]